MATNASSSAAILSTMKHVTKNKWDKAQARLEEIKGYVRAAEAEMSYKADSPDANQNDLEADVAKLLAAVRKSYAGALNMQVSARTGLRARGGSVRSLSPFKTIEGRLKTIERMLSNAKYSSGFSPSAALSWRNELLDYLRHAQHRMEYTILFGKLTNEWADFRFGELSDSIGSAKKGTDKLDASDDGSTAAVGRKEMYEQRQVWERLVTNLRTSDKGQIVAFLDDLFHSGPRYEKKEDSVEELTDLRADLLRGMRHCMFTMSERTINVDVATVKAAIKAILAADQLTSDKRRAMIDMSNRENVLSEIADILKIDLKLAAIGRWSWGDSPIKAQMRKAINGKYRVYMDIELLDSILIQCVGQSISVFIYNALQSTWTPRLRGVWRATEDEGRNAAIESHLPGYDGRDSDSMDDEYDSNLTPLTEGPPNVFNLRTDILRVCSAEMNVQKIVHGQFCLLQSDFEWFGPSLPHSTLITIMEYFNFPEELVKFTQSFLDMKMQFQEDGANGPVLTRKTGIPVSFQLTDGISELLLFALDFAVNQKTGGAHIYRNHDDLWFWGQPSQCVVAWETISEFTKVMGLTLNKDKTAFAHAVDESNPRFKRFSSVERERLPSGKVKWGFLLFDEKQWKWTANKAAIEDHMDELRFQLKTRTSVMSHVQAYNAYMKNFLPNNFGPVVMGLGDEHPIMVLEALQYAQRHLYRSDNDEKTSGNVATHLRKTIKKRFGEDGRYTVPDCFLYMDVEYGGLGLANPAPAFAQFIQLPKYSQRDGDRTLPPMKNALEQLNSSLSEDYRRENKQFVTRLNNKKRKHMMDYKQFESDESEIDDAHAEFTKRIDGVPQFISFSTYMGTTEEYSSYMTSFYETLLDEPDRLDRSISNKNWAARMFDAELEEIFGGFIAEEEFLSRGLYRTLAEEKVRWSG